MSKFDIYVKVSILINYNTNQPSNLAWNVSLTSWLCDIGVRFSVCLSVHSSVRLSTFMSKFDIYVKVSTCILINYKTKQPSNIAWNSSLTSWLCVIGIPFSVHPTIHPSVCLNIYIKVRHLCQSSTFMSKFDIYVNFNILINYNSTTTIIPCMTHLPDLLTWHVHWPGDLDLYFALQWLWHNLLWCARSSQLQGLQVPNLA